MSILRDGYAITKLIRDSYMSPSVNLLMCSKNSICQGKILKSSDKHIIVFQKIPHGKPDHHYDIIK